MTQHCAGQEGTTMRRSGEWLFCPKCQKRTRVKVYENTVMVHFPLYCHWCKTEFNDKIFFIHLPFLIRCFHPSGSPEQHIQSQSDGRERPSLFL